MNDREEGWVRVKFEQRQEEEEEGFSLLSLSRRRLGAA